jgi:L-ascorbate metabolism protein UlaG (beta-lactamase superfamily)
MRVEWLGHSAFLLRGEDGTTVAIDPFGDMSALVRARGVQWDYPPVSAEAQVLLVTHEHGDHNAVDAISGEPHTLRSTAGTHESPLGSVTGIASEHDDAAGTERGPNTIFVFELDGLRIAHMGDFGQSGLREEQAAALEGVDLLFVPVGGGFTIGAEQATLVVERLQPRWAVPMHYRTHRIGFLETADEFLEKAAAVERVEGSSFQTGELTQTERPLVVVPAAP